MSTSKGSTNRNRTDTPKRLIVCCDGTGQSSNQDIEAPPTNVTRLCRALETSVFFEKENKEVQQVVMYQTGIGTDTMLSVSSIVAETFGVGVDTHVLEAYNFFANNYEEGDQLFVFGFSRGAFTARSLASFICHAGLLKSDDIALLPGLWKAYKQRNKQPAEWTKRSTKGDRFLGVPIEILGVWDTVGSLGVPQTWISDVLKFTKLRAIIEDPFNFHDTSLAAGSKYASINRAYQALALDERRRSFQPTLLYTEEYECISSAQAGVAKIADDESEEGTKVINCWFAGVHSDIGGSYSRKYRDISDLTLAWMIDQIGDSLKFKNTLHDLQMPPLDPVTLEPKPAVEPDRWGLSALHDSMTWKFKLGGFKDRTPGEYVQSKSDNPAQREKAIEYVHPSVRMRMLQDTHRVEGSTTEGPYQPPALAGFELETTVKVVNNEEVVRWAWVKKVTDKDNKETVIRLPEHTWSKNEGPLEPELLETDDKNVLSDVKMKAKVHLVPKSTWWDTIRFLNPF